MTEHDCPCETPEPLRNRNLPGQDWLDYRLLEFKTVRRALLQSQPGEKELLAWRPGAQADLALQVIEWWAYLADILSLYNERSANEAYLRTAQLPETVYRLIRTLGYRPKPAISAHGHLAVLTSSREAFTLAKGFATDSKPGPGEQVQTFELDQDTPIGPSAAVITRPLEFLLQPNPTELLLNGQSTALSTGTLLLVSVPIPSSGSAVSVLRVESIRASTRSDGAVQSHIRFIPKEGNIPSNLRALDVSIAYPTQHLGLWPYPASGVVSGTVLHLAGMVRFLRPRDRLLLVKGETYRTCTIIAVQEAIWFANPSDINTPNVAPAAPAIPIPVAHTVLTVDVDLNAFNTATEQVTVHCDWRTIEGFEDQAASTTTPLDRLEASPEQVLRAGSNTPVLLEWANGLGAKARVGNSAGGLNVTLADPDALPAIRELPITVHYDLLSVSRGKTTNDESLGIGDASLPGQEFVLKKAPVTYLAHGSGYRSTLELRVNGRRWHEADSFYAQAANAEIFVTFEDEQGKTHVKTGDGVNGARLPTGARISATYRYGAGELAPKAGQLTVIAKADPRVRSLRNPVAVGGGADPEPKEQIRRYAPRSVLSFHRAVSADDYEVIAALAPEVKRARSYWAWNADEQRGTVVVYVGDTPSAVASAKEALFLSSDPNRHVTVRAASAIECHLSISLRLDPEVPSDQARAAVLVALTAPEGLFGTGLRIGQTVFDSQIYQRCLEVPGVLAIPSLNFFPSKQVGESTERHVPNEGEYFVLQPNRVRFGGSRP
jgi:Baseplate J-like protein